MRAIGSTDKADRQAFPSGAGTPCLGAAVLSWRQRKDLAGTKMTHRARSLRTATSALLPVTTAALAIAILVAQVRTSEKLTAGLFYVLVVLLAARFCNARGVVLVGVGCIGLTLLAFFLPGLTETHAGNVGLKASIAAAVIGLTTFLALKSRSAEATLRERAALLDLTHDSIVARRFDDDVITYWSRGAEELYGWPRADAVGSVGSELGRTTVPLPLEEIKAELLRVGRWEGELVNSKRDGTPVLVTSRWSLQRDRRGRPAVMLATSNDITERRRADQRRDALHAVTRVLAGADSLADAASHLLRAIGENLEWDWGALWSFARAGDQEGPTLRCDSVWHAPHIETAEFAEFDMIRQKRAFAAGEGRLGQVWRSGVPAWMVDATTEPGFLRASVATRAGLHGGVIFPILLDADALGVAEFFSRAPQERDEEQLATLSAIGSQIGQFIKRRSAEEGLRASEERWRRLFETSSVGMGLFQLDGLCTAANPALQRMLGRTEEEIVRHNVLELNHEDERAATADALVQYRSGSLTERRVEKKYLKRDGSPIWLDITNTLVPATDTAAPFLLAVYVDVTERVRFEAALRASEERWRAMFETAPVGIAMLDFEHRHYLVANECFQRMTGYTEDELRQLTTLDLTHEDDRAAMQQRIDDGTIGVLQQKRYRRKDGEVIWADVTSFVVPATDSTPAFRGAVIVDITGRKRTERALQQAQADLARLNRVMLLEEMAASIAHEVNQPIAAVITNASAGLRWLGAHQPDLGEVRQALGRIVRDGSRAGEVIGRIRTLAKKIPPRRDRLDFNETIREAVALTQTEMQRNGIKLQSRLADDLPLVLADRVQLQQVLINLIVNAIEAMSGASEPPRELTIVSGIGNPNDVFVEVQDTGPGVDPEQLDRLFQSFYTTKPDGIGMGLAISRSIAEAHGGQLSAAPHRPHGAVFRFALPVEDESSAHSVRPVS